MLEQVFRNRRRDLDPKARTSQLDHMRVPSLVIVPQPDRAAHVPSTRFGSTSSALYTAYSWVMTCRGDPDDTFATGDVCIPVIGCQLDMLAGISLLNEARERETQNYTLLFDLFVSCRGIAVVPPSAYHGISTTSHGMT